MASALTMAAPAAFADDTSAVGTMSVADCTAADVRVVELNREGAAGNVYIDLLIVKLPPQNPYADEACVMYGELAQMYWGDDQGDRIGGTAEQDGDAVTPFGLFPGDEARVTITRPNPENFNAAECEPTEVGGAYLSFVNDDETVYVPTDGRDRVCANPDLGAPRISAITPAGA
ncbi:DUF4232 domain-containing protein [Marinactinospora rubrisoli]|uniref:DUF4232 domain-containing protein n=1 Tax=Marinactinospora rubrisoli TaxID=2715399 RepID=A0ABW2KIF3_9ACTN